MKPNNIDITPDKGSSTIDSSDSDTSSGWLQDFIEHLSLDELTQLKQLLSNQGDNTNEDQGNAPSYEDFKKVTGA